MSFKIGRLAQLTNFEPGLLRAWERRYALLQPQRLENGYRIYSADDLALLSRVRVLLDEGMAISDIARLGRERLIREAGDPALRPAQPPPLVQPLPPEEDHRLDDPTSRPELAWDILDALPCAVIVTDARGRVRWVNRGVPILCGYDLADLHGLIPGKVLQGPGTDPGTVQRLRAAIAARRPCSVRILNYHRSGEPYLALLDVSPLGVGSSHLGFVGIARRLDERPPAQ